MKSKIIKFIKQKGILFGLLSFLIPVVIMALAYYKVDVLPIEGHRSILASDAYSQYSMFFGGFNNLIRNGESLLFNWYASLGLNNVAFMSYYLNSLFTPLALLFENIHMDYFMYYLTLLKFGCLGLGFWVYASQTFKINRWQHLILAISYALMSFAVAYSEITMWFDGLMYLPLVILGVNRLMDQKKPVVLFVFYFLLFISNFYIAFMIGVFSFLYFLARFATGPSIYKRSVLLYLGTSFAAGGASMPIIIPTVLDITSNGESLTEITRLFTKTAAPLSIFIKNMVGVYDSTKYDTVPFIYAGTLALVFCIFFFLTKKITKRMKLAYGSVLGFIFISFNIEALDLLWQGLHAPNMFLFRYSFTFSFMVLMLAGYGWEKYSKEDFSKIMRVIVTLFAIFLGVKIYTNFNEDNYKYFYISSLLWSTGSLFSLLGLFWLKQKEKLPKISSLLMVGVVVVELWANTTGLVVGILHDWTYPNYIGVTNVYNDIETLVDYTKEETPDSFYRMENLTPITMNDSFLFGYSGVSMFSSIRNRHSSQYLDQLGFRSKGTNLNVLYANNTLLMDSLLGIKYNLSKEEDSLKFGYRAIQTSGDYTLYENEYVLPLGILTDDWIYQEGAVDNQTKLINHLAGQDENESMFAFTEAEVIDSKNIDFDSQIVEGNNVEIVTYARTNPEEPMEITYEVEVPAKQQAYLTIYQAQTDGVTGAPIMKAEVNGTTHSWMFGRVGQYISLGYHEEAQTVQVKLTFTYTKAGDEEKSVIILKPDAALMDTEKFVSTLEKIQEKGVDIEVNGRHASASVDLKEDQVLMTTIPYDKGWRAYVDGEEVEIPTFKDAFLTIPLAAGKYTVELVYFPYGMRLGLWIAGGSVLLFLAIIFWLRKKHREEPQWMSNVSAEPAGECTQKLNRLDEQSTSGEIQEAPKESTVAETSEPNERLDGAEGKTKQKQESLVTTFSFSQKEEDPFSFDFDTTRIKKSEDPPKD
ncbi:YfhO family protein [Enterococcus sp. BWR-S5]|uniref:YfhO family protein n=1 Tax=Enterococcus sp. BWR-S5 TaxID=2787714 RepID=UPI0019239E77|nr:YfhO family protein [Enterococcus sp. BWR-S5]MBL1225815.1 YfhO family protein [Enterococcus sp. BWR-S5]